MRRLVIVTALVLALAVIYFPYRSPATATGTLTLPGPAPNSGEPAPNFTTKTVNGDTFELSDDGVYVLAFWSTLNVGSNDSRTDFRRLARDYETDDVSFVAVYVSNMSDESYEAPYTVLKDNSGRLTSLYNIKRVPRLFLIKNGTVELVQNGYHSENYALLRGELRKALEGNQSAKAHTKLQGQID